ncbi:DoxX family protein [Hymenobacter sp. HMF4947]|uniref:DoxX family protein n=1 Tax=Hymenobacter ginkgonis TaxID=2682976 RepID=A0A7K1TBE2_9BACT|nr:DoxX family protein [Hymenobacter ginkgonis]MVN75728.1 DoxX family protein [Hymenobacter ginkgonis]
MKPRTLILLHWGLIGFFALLMLADGLAGALQVQGGQNAMRHLGYPLYTLLIFGSAKILGALALLQPWWRTLKEWAFAGFAINFVGAAASHLLAGDGLSAALPALVMLAVLLGLHYLWRRYLAAQAKAPELGSLARTVSA